MFISDQLELSEELSSSLSWTWAPQLAQRPNALFKFTWILESTYALARHVGQETSVQNTQAPVFEEKREKMAESPPTWEWTLPYITT